MRETAPICRLCGLARRTPTTCYGNRTEQRTTPLRHLPGTIQGPAATPELTYRKADLHLHSNFSYDVLNLPELSPRALYDKAVAKGMGFFCLTDHDTMKGYEALRAELAREFGDQPPIPLISGVEIKVKDPKIRHTVHVNVLGLDRRDWGSSARRRRSHRATSSPTAGSTTSTTPTTIRSGSSAASWATWPGSPS